MKKILLSLAFMGVSAMSFGQTKTTGTVALSLEYSIRIDLNNTLNVATFTFIGTSSAWMGIGLDATGMSSAGKDCIQVGTAIFDRRLSGSQSQPITDATANLTLVSNTITSGVRTVVLTRPLNTGDTNDYTFNYATITTLNVIWGLGTSTAVTSGHYDRGAASLSFTTLGVEDFSLNTTAIYPNPSTGIFNIHTKTSLDKINVYSQIGAFVKTIEVDGSNNIEINLKGLQSGIYLLELQNSTEKSWKKIILE
jgi:hypothetical protein